MNLNSSLIRAGDHVICAVSGGADSMALLWSLYTRRQELSITVAAAHFNHRLRGAESERDERFVRDFCDRHGISLTVGSADVRTLATEKKLGLEEAAREVRYAFFDTLPCDKIALAHNAQDNAETVLQHMLRGSGLRGLCGIAPQRGKIIRPLLSVSREEIEAFLRENGINWVLDSSNESLDYTRNRIRHEILPLLLRENPSFLPSIASHCEILRAEDELLDTYARELLDRAREGEKYQCKVLLSAPDALQKRALRLLVRGKLPQDVASAHVSQMQKLLKNASPSAVTALPHGLILRRYYDLVALEENKAVQSFTLTPIRVDENSGISLCGWEISCHITENLQLFKNSPFHFALKYDMISEHGIAVRPRQCGDMLTLSCRKSLKKWLIEKKIPLHERDGLPIFVSGEQIVAAAAVGVDRAFTAREGERAVVILIRKTAV